MKSRGSELYRRCIMGRHSRTLRVFLCLLITVAMATGCAKSAVTSVTEFPSATSKALLFTPIPAISPKTETSHQSEIATKFSGQIANIDLNDTAALATLFRISGDLEAAQSSGSLLHEEVAGIRAFLMEKISDWVNVRRERLDRLSPVSAQSQNVWPPRDRELLNGAAERIERYRKGNVTIFVNDEAGLQINNATVQIDMLRHDFLFGTTIFELFNGGSLEKDYEDKFAQLFNYATLPFYWSQYESWQGRENETRLKNMAAWASDHGITTKGHPLVWPAYAVPNWAIPLSSTTMDEVQHDRVTRIVERFRGLINYWDVVNEATNGSGFVKPFDDWMKVHTSPGAVALALRWARASNPEATLLLNDYEISDKYRVFLKDVQAAGGKFDVIGIQSHMHTGQWTLGKVWDTCERFKDFNLPLHFTETTVLSGNLKTDNDWMGPHPGWDTTPDGEARQGEYVPALYTILFSHPSLQAITWWDLSDFNSWQGAPSGLIRKDMTSKPAYERLMQLIQTDWWTNTSSGTDSQGKAAMRGFGGQYLLTVKSGTRSTKTLISIKANQDNIFEVRLPKYNTPPIKPGVTTVLPSAAPSVIGIATPTTPAGNPQFTQTPTILTQYGTLEPDVVYGMAGGVELKMGIWQPKQSNNKKPVIIFVHSGGFMSGDKSEIATSPMAAHWLGRGYLVASVNYRLSPKYIFPAEVEDVKCSVRFLRQNAVKYGINPDKIGACGVSAGGYLVNMMGLCDASAGFDNSGGYFNQSSKVQAVANLFGISDIIYQYEQSKYEGANGPTSKFIGGADKFYEIAPKANPINYVSSDDPPFLIMHGDQDDQVLPKQSEVLHNKLIAAKVSSTLVWVKNAGHGFAPIGQEPVSPATLARNTMIADFFDKYLK